MTIQEKTIITPLPTVDLLHKREQRWHITLPKDYRDFIIKNNGGVPNDLSFVCNNHSYAVARFLCVLENYKDSQFGWYDISVVVSQIEERLTDNLDLIGVEVLPIAELFAGDYVCLDYRADKNSPSICVWSHEESGEFAPVTYKVADSFAEFLSMLK